jgi:hypothetical protein
VGDQLRALGWAGNARALGFLFINWLFVKTDSIEYRIIEPCMRFYFEHASEIILVGKKGTPLMMGVEQRHAPRHRPLAQNRVVV